MNNKPVKSDERDNTGEYYWMCPSCGNKVGGYIITGSGSEDWSCKKDKFCSECGTKIDWS
jgi:hypothetical protein